MDIYRIDRQHLPLAMPFWADSQETMIWSALQGYMGSIWVDDLEKPTCSRIIIADFMFLAGEPNRRMIAHKPEDYPSNCIDIVPDTDDWNDLIERYYDGCCKKHDRYAIRKEPEIFDEHHLRRIVAGLNTKRYALVDTDKEEAMYRFLRNPGWTFDSAACYPTFEDYRKKGIGCAIVLQNAEGNLPAGTPVSYATSYTHYSNGIEIEVDTHPDYRRMGLASQASAALILRCLEYNLYPSWDAANKESVALSEKLGYHYDHSYTSYWVEKY